MAWAASMYAAEKGKARKLATVRSKTLAVLDRAIVRTVSLLTSPKIAYFLGEPFFTLFGFRKRRPRFDLGEVGSVLVVRPDEIGDVVLTTPFLRELRGNLPSAWITLVVKPDVVNLVELCPHVNEVLPYDWAVAERFRPLWRHLRASRLAVTRLFRRHFDLAVLPRWDADYYHGAFLAYFSGAWWRVGYSHEVTEEKKLLNMGWDILLTEALYDLSVRHEVERNLDLITSLGGQVRNDSLELWIGPEDERWAEDILEKCGINSSQMLIGLGVGAGAAKRMWPLSNFVRLGEWLKREYGARILVIGGYGEERLGEHVKGVLGQCVINAVGLTTLRQSAALMRRCVLFVGNDAAPVHMAAAVGVPVIQISCHPSNGRSLHYNSPDRFRPWGVPHVVVRPYYAVAPCTDACAASEPHCIAAVTTRQVQEAVGTLLALKTLSDVGKVMPS